jgi:hypothetical protein
VEGGQNQGWDSIAGPSSPRPGGTIIQHDFQYRAAARPGLWKVERAFLNKDHVGFVVCHSSQSGKELLERCSHVKFGEPSKDKNIVFVNRYDWSYHHGNEEETIKALRKAGYQEKDKKKRKTKDKEESGEAESDEAESDEAESDEEEDELDEKFSKLFGSRLFVIDASQLDALLKCIVGTELKKKNVWDSRSVSLIISAFTYRCTERVMNLGGWYLAVRSIHRYPMLTNWWE